MGRKLHFEAVVVALLLGIICINSLSAFPANGNNGTNDASLNGTEVDVPAMENSGKVKLTVVYETLCPDSMAFVKRQLKPTYEKLKAYIDLELVPWGKASYKRVDDTYTFTCQHGAQECYGNKIHACVLGNYNLEQTVRFVQCTMSSRDTVGSSESCAREANLDWSVISTCANGKMGSDLLQKHGVRTENLNPQLVFVPWILINDRFSEAQLEQSLENLTGVICNQFKNKPNECLQL